MLSRGILRPLWKRTFARAIYSPLHKLKKPPPPPETYETFEPNYKLLRPHVDPRATRLRLPKPDKFLVSYGGGVDIPVEEHSCYFAIEKDGSLYHFFNANKYTLGRMASHIAYVLQGKNSPLSKRYLIDHKQYCIVVNSDQPKVKGSRKLETKRYQSHTGHPGGFKDIKMKDLLKKDSIKFLKQVIRGMLPKNSQIYNMMARLHIFKGNYHNFELPQFYPQFPVDPNRYLGYDAITPDSKIIFHSDKEVPPELKHLKVELDPDITTPENYYEQVRGRGKKHIYANARLEGWAHKVKRYKTTRPI